MIAPRPLHIAISARALSLPFGGVREYVGALLRELLALDTPHRFTIYYSDPALVGSHPRASEVVLRAPHKFFWDHAALPLRLHNDCPDVVWFPHNVISLGCRIPAVLTVYDLLYFRVPEFSQREYAWPDTLYMRAFIPRSLHKARSIATISKWTANDIIRLTGTPPAKIRVIYPAAGRSYRPVTDAESQSVRTTYRLERPFFFYAGILSARKNVRLLVEAFGQASNDLPHDLVITAGRGYIETPYDDVVARYGIEGRVRRLGLVPKEDLVALYNQAAAFVFPSRYEGFGIPPLEAMACGCPVICSNATSLPEVVGDAALTFGPDDAATLAAHLRAVAGDQALRERLVQAGLAQAQQFSYAQAARQLRDLLEAAAG